jgi:hypothetical protein
MSDRLLFIGYGEVVRGREERAVAVFNEGVGFYGRCQQEGRLESFDVVFLGRHGGHLVGYFELHGSPEQLFALREDPEFQRHLVAANLIVDDLRWSRATRARDREADGAVHGRDRQGPADDGVTT